MAACSAKGSDAGEPNGGAAPSDGATGADGSGGTGGAGVDGGRAGASAMPDASEAGPVVDAALTEGGPAPAKLDLLGRWEIPYFDDRQMLSETWHLHFARPDEWEQSRPASNVTQTGTFAVNDSLLTLEQRTLEGMGGSDDGDPSTIETTRTAKYYADDFLFSDGPYERQGGGDDALAGTWARTITLRSGPGLQTIERVTETLSFTSDGKWTETRTSQVSGPGSPRDQSRSGTYSTAPAEGYEGAFLIRTIAEQDGSQLTPRNKLTELYSLRGVLLIRPAIRER